MRDVKERGRTIESVIEYSKYNKGLLENYTKEILEQDEFGLYSCYTISFQISFPP